MGKKGKRKTGAEKKSTTANKEILALCQEILGVVSKDFPVRPSAQWEEYHEVQVLVEQIRGKQAGEGISWEDHSREEYVEEFTKWFTQNGGKADSVKVHKFGEEGFGLIAVSDIIANDVFVTVPKKLMMTVESAKKSELGSLINKDPILSSMDHSALTLHILCEKLRNDSSWKPYLDILPSSYTTSLYFSSEDLKTLQGSSSLGDALKPYRSIARQYAYFYRLLQAHCDAPTLKKSFTFDDFRWAVSTVMTRQNQVPVSDTQSMKALIPMWDMCNHCNGTITTGFDSEEKACKSLALRSFKAGEQVFIFYGKRNSADLLFHNGFVFDDNQNDWMNIHLGVSRSDRLYAMKAQILAMVAMDSSVHPYPVLHGSDPISPELRTFLRIFCMNEGELKIRLFNPEGKKVAPLSELSKAEFILSEENELKIWSFLNMRLSLILGQYKTSIKDDEERLRSDDLSVHTRNCIKLLITEKMILDSAKEYSQSMMEKVNSSEGKEYVQPMMEKVNSNEDKEFVQPMMEKVNSNEEKEFVQPMMEKVNSSEDKEFVQPMMEKVNSSEDKEYVQSMMEKVNSSEDKEYVQSMMEKVNSNEDKEFVQPMMEKVNSSEDKEFVQLMMEKVNSNEDKEFVQPMMEKVNSSEDKEYVQPMMEKVNSNEDKEFVQPMMEKLNSSEDKKYAQPMMEKVNSNEDKEFVQPMMEKVNSSEDKEFIQPMMEKVNSSENKVGRSEESKTVVVENDTEEKKTPSKDAAISSIMNQASKSEVQDSK